MEYIKWWYKFRREVGDCNNLSLQENTRSESYKKPYHKPTQVGW